MRRLVIPVIAASLLLSGCGGGGGSSRSAASQGGSPDSTSQKTVAANDSASTSTNMPVYIPVLENDSSASGAFPRLKITVPPKYGSATINPGGDITYVPEADFAGKDSFKYAFQGAAGEWVSATVKIDIRCDACPDINISLTWNQASDDIKGYLIYYGNKRNNVTRKVADIPVPIYSANMGKDFGLYGGEKICFSVRAYHNSAISDPSPPVCGTI